MPRSQATSSGVSLFTVLLVVFVVLKLTDNIAWSWAWVLSPMWIPLAVGALVAAIAAPFWIADSYIKRRRLQREWAKRHGVAP